MTHAHYLFADTPDVEIVLTHPGPRALCAIVGVVPAGARRVVHALWHGIGPTSIESMDIRVCYNVDGTPNSYDILKRPLMIAVSDRLLYATWLVGYREVTRDPIMRHTYYARPWLLVAALRLREEASVRFWGAVSWLEVRGWLYVGPDGQAGHFYSFRPGKRLQFWRKDEA